MLPSPGAGEFSQVEEAQGTGRQERRTTAAGPQHLLHKDNLLILVYAAGWQVPSLLE